MDAGGGTKATAAQVGRIAGLLEQIGWDWEAARSALGVAAPRQEDLTEHEAAEVLGALVEERRRRDSAAGMW